MKGLTTEMAAASTQAPDMIHREPTTEPAPKRNSYPRQHWRWTAAKALPLILPFLATSTIMGVPPRKQHTSEHSNNRNHKRHDRINNRQLLEHGLRGGTEVGGGEGSELLVGKPDQASFNPIRVSNTTIAMHAQSGTHHVHLYIGSPPQRQTLIVDTGSRAMAFPCKTCETCGNCCGTHASPYFDPSRSTTHFVSSCGSCLLEGISSCGPQLLGGSVSGTSYCSFSQKYTEGSAWTAIEVEDLVWLGSSNVVESLEEYMPALAVAYPFGCQASSTGLFRKQYADGILGLLIHETSLLTAFYNEGLISSNAFSLCLTQKGGVLSLGGSLDPKKYHFSKYMKTTPITRLNEHGYYSVEVIRLVVGNGTIVTDAGTKPKLLRDMNSGKGCVLDSGTTDSYFPASLSKAVRRAVIEYGNAVLAGTDTSNLDPFSPRLRQRMYTYREFKTLLPTITVVFANEVSLKILPKHYMEHVPMDATSGDVVEWEGTKGLTNRLYFEESGGPVLGANALIGYDILFDNGSDGHEARIGIAPSDCQSAASDAAAVS